MSELSENKTEMRPARLTLRQATVLAVMPAGQPATVRWVAEQIGVPAAHLADTLLVLERRGLVRHHRATLQEQDTWGRQVRHLWTRLA